MNRFKKLNPIAAITGITGALMVSASAAVDPAAVTAELTSALTSAEVVLVAGIAVVVTFYGFALLKKAVRASK